MFSFGKFKFLDSFNLLAMSPYQMAKLYHCKTKTLYQYEYFSIDMYQRIIGNLKKVDIKFSLSNKFGTKNEISLLLKTGKNW